MIPIRFGTLTRELSGIYQPGSGRTEQTACVVFCNPFGQEAIRCHRLYRVLADRLCRNGLHVLRFDYFATGDSAGADDEGDIDGWIDDVLQANEEAVRRSGCAHCSWFGLRLGASLAAFASGRLGRSPNRLIMWNPVIEGLRYLADLADAHIASSKAAYRSRWTIERRLRDITFAETNTEALGFPLTDTLKSQLRAMSLSSFNATRAERIALFSERIGDDVGALEQQLVANGNNVSVTQIQTGINWTTNQALNSVIAPLEALQRIAATILENR